MCSPDALRLYATRRRVINGGAREAVLRMRPAPQQRLYPIIPIFKLPWIHQLRFGAVCASATFQRNDVKQKCIKFLIWNTSLAYACPWPLSRYCKKRLWGVHGKAFLHLHCAKLLAPLGSHVFSLILGVFGMCECCKSRSYLWNWLVACSALIFCRHLFNLLKQGRNKLQ